MPLCVTSSDILAALVVQGLFASPVLLIKFVTSLFTVSGEDSVKVGLNIYLSISFAICKGGKSRLLPFPVP
jgi:hypothetical protein